MSNDIIISQADIDYAVEKRLLTPDASWEEEDTPEDIKAATRLWLDEVVDELLADLHEWALGPRPMGNWTRCLRKAQARREAKAAAAKR